MPKHHKLGVCDIEVFFYPFDCCEFKTYLTVLAELSMPSLFLICLKLTDTTEATLVDPLIVMLLLYVFLVVFP